MSLLLDDLGVYLQAQSIGTVGTDLFKGILPESPDDCISIDQSGGVEPDRELPLEKPTIQVLVRNDDYATGLTKAKAIYDLLHRAGHDNGAEPVLKVGGVDVMDIFAMQEPFHLGKDENERDLFTLNFVFYLRSA